MDDTVALTQDETEAAAAYYERNENVNPRVKRDNIENIKQKT